MSQGPIGPQGIVGRRGLQGTPYGYPGTAFYSTAGRVPVVNVTSGTSISPATSGYGTLYNIRTAITGITFPSVPGGDVGAFWTFRNNSGSTLAINLTTGTATYNGDAAATSVQIADGNSLTFVFVSGTSYVAI